MDVNPVVAESRKRCFWVLYIVEKGISTRLGRPSSIPDDDIDTEYPAEVVDESITAAGIVSNPIFDPEPLPLGDRYAMIINFSKICSQVYRRLYRAQVVECRSGGNLALAICDLDAELNNWRDKLPFKLWPSTQFYEFMRKYLSERTKDTSLHGICSDAHKYVPIVAHLMYFNCICAIHRPSLIELKSTNLQQTSPQSSYDNSKTVQGNKPSAKDPRVYASAVVCVNAARATLQFVQEFVDFGPANWLW